MRPFSKGVVSVGLVKLTHKVKRTDEDHQHYTRTYGCQYVTIKISLHVLALGYILSLGC